MTYEELKKYFEKEQEKNKELEAIARKNIENQTEAEEMRRKGALNSLLEKYNSKK